MVIMMMIFKKHELASQINPEYVIDVLRHPFDQGLELFKVINYST